MTEHPATRCPRLIQTAKRDLIVVLSQRHTPVTDSYCTDGPELQTVPTRHHRPANIPMNTIQTITALVDPRMKLIAVLAVIGMEQTGGFRAFSLSITLENAKVNVARHSDLAGLSSPDPDKAQAAVESMRATLTAKGYRFLLMNEALHDSAVHYLQMLGVKPAPLTPVADKHASGSLVSP